MLDWGNIRFDIISLIFFGEPKYPFPEETSPSAS